MTEVNENGTIGVDGTVTGAEDAFATQAQIDPPALIETPHNVGQVIVDGDQNEIVQGSAERLPDDSIIANVTDDTNVADKPAVEPVTEPPADA